MLSNIEAERARHNLTRQGLSEFLGITTKTYAKYINGDSSIPSKLLIKMADAFGCTVDYLLGLPERKKDA